MGVFRDERVDIVSESEWIEEGTPVRVVSAEGYRQVVRPIRNTGEDTGAAGPDGVDEESVVQESSEQEPSDQEPSEVADV